MDTINGLLNSGGLNWKSLMSKGMKVFLDKVDPEEVNLVKHPNGVSIQIKCDGESRKMVEEFWEDYVQEKIE